MFNSLFRQFTILGCTLLGCEVVQQSVIYADVGVGAKPLEGAEVLLDGKRETLDDKWTYWQGPRFGSSLPIKWKIVDDPTTSGTVVQTDDPAAAGGKYGAADIITKKEYRDFRLHVEFNVMNPKGNSGVYLQNRYEIQIVDGDQTKHGMGAIINEADSPYYAYNGVGAWNSYDFVFRAARFQNGVRTDKAKVTIYFNGLKTFTDYEINQVWGGPNSGMDGGNDKGRGITDRPGGLKLQCEGHDVRYRNVWIKELTLDDKSTDFSEPLAAISLPLKSENLKSLFNSKDLSGWEGDETRWVADRGMIRGANEDRVPTSTYLFTNGKYRNFRLICDVKQTMSEKHSTMHSAVAALGEQFTDNGNNKYGFRGPLFMFCHDWGIWDAYRRNRVVPVGPGSKLERKGEWNQIEILVNGNRLRMAANGELVFDFNDQPDMLQSSPIGLQLHSNDKPQEFFFRHVLVSDNPSMELLTLRK